MATAHDVDSESAAFLHQDQPPPPAQRKHGLAALAARYWPHALLGLGFVLGLVIVTSPGAGRASVEAAAAAAAGATSLESQAMLGELPKKRVVFWPDPSYDVDPFGPDELDTPWATLAPAGKGHIRVEEPAKWQLAGGYPLPDAAHPAAEEYTIALYHQLHCLATLKSRMSRLQDWYRGDNDKEYLTFALGQDHVSDAHIYHCFDYLRQALLCHGDTTLEKARVDAERGTLVRGVDGWGVQHECRDTQAIDAFARAHRSRNDTGLE